MRRNRGMLWPVVVVVAMLVGGAGEAQEINPDTGHYPLGFSLGFETTTSHELNLSANGQTEDFTVGKPWGAWGIAYLAASPQATIQMGVRYAAVRYQIPAGELGMDPVEFDQVTQAERLWSVSVALKFYIGPRSEWAK